MTMILSLRCSQGRALSKHNLTGLHRRFERKDCLATMRHSHNVECTHRQLALPGSPDRRAAIMPTASPLVHQRTACKVTNSTWRRRPLGLRFKRLRMTGKTPRQLSSIISARRVDHSLCRVPASSNGAQNVISRQHDRQTFAEDGTTSHGSSTQASAVDRSSGLPHAMHTE